MERPVASFEIDPIKEPLARSGFRRIDISVQGQEHDILDVTAFARGLVFSPLVEKIRERGTVDAEEIVEALAAIPARDQGSNPARLPMQAIVFEAEKP
ncbi:hypothetical protein [Nitrosovibrio sp. Nv17]|uniref:hypothetical protein n=1 Tax=Nitrosovibrio sp. Nv17 TaxID=1855339 RepID=UPI0009086821|nr:hypothetical protein [Nitrosovibrio sp. Nv17]SFW25607.1 hypothetical protein SAMN05216414_10910 [Nitrosovibrio sp. Nv17]